MAVIVPFLYTKCHLFQQVMDGIHDIGDFIYPPVTFILSVLRRVT